MPSIPARRSALALAGVLAATSVVLVGGGATTALAGVAPGQTELLSRPDGFEGQTAQPAVETELAGDGRSAVFATRASLDDIDNEFTINVFVRDVATGRTTQVSRGFVPPPIPTPTPTPTTPLPTPTTTTTPDEPPPIGWGGPRLLSLQPTAPPGPPAPVAAPNGRSDQPSISADGRYVAFLTEASNIVGGDPDDYGDIVVCDRDPDGDGVFDERDDADVVQYAYHRANDPDYVGEGTLRDDYPTNPDLSADGSRIVWTESGYTDGAGYFPVVRWRELAAGAPATPEATVPAGLPFLVPFGQYGAVISGDGGHVVMAAEYNYQLSLRAGPVLRLNGARQVYPQPDIRAMVVTDLATGAVTRVDVDLDGAVLGDARDIFSRHPTISADGSVVVFETERYTDYGFYDPDWRPTYDQPALYLVRPGATPLRSQAVSRGNAGEAINGARPALSADGRYLAFVTDTPGAHDGVDLPETPDSCLHEVVTLRAAPPLRLAPGVPGEAVERARTRCQVVVRDTVLDDERAAAALPRVPGTLASPGLDRTCSPGLDPTQQCAGDSDSGYIDPAQVLDTSTVGESAPSLTTDGSRVAYDSAAGDLVVGDENGYQDSFQRTFTPGLVADPVDFGTVGVGDTVNRTATVRTTGAGPVRVQAIEVDGPDADDFTVGAGTCVGQVLHQAGSCLSAVRFTPSGTGTKVGRLVIRTSDGRVFTVDLRGGGTTEDVVPPNAEFSAAPDPLAFGPRLLLVEDPTSVVTVRNLGGSPMSVGAITALGPGAPEDYSVVANTCATVAPGGSCQVTVRFRPTLPGERAAVLSFADSAPGGPHLIALGGQGSTPAIDVNPAVSPPGRVTTVSGTGFPPNSTIALGYEGFVETATVVTGNEGAFRVSLLVFPKASVGTRTVVATVVGSAPVITATKPLLIVYPSASPPEFLTRG